MKFKSTVGQIALTGIMTALAIVFGMFAHFPLFGTGGVYLIGVVVLIMPAILKIPYALIGGVFSVVMVDLYTGWAAYTWISVIAYSTAILIVWAFTFIKIKLLFIPGLILAALVIITIYYFLEVTTFDKALAISGVIDNAIQFSIVIPITAIIYMPLSTLIKK